MSALPEQQRFIPVCQLPTILETDQNTPLTWDFDLPPTIEQDRIVVDAHRVARLQRVAAFSSSHVISYQGETTTYTPTINGVNANGTATAGFAGQLQKAPRSEEHLHDEFPFKLVMQNAGKTKTLHALNKAEIVQAVTDRDAEQSREQAWAQQLNSALTASMRSTARKHLVTRAPGPIAAIHTAYAGITSGNLVVNIATHDTAGTAYSLTTAGVVWITSLAIHAGFNRDTVGSSLLKEWRWTLNPLQSIQADRYLAMDGLSRALPIITARK